ncbi:glycosyltransferase family 2 protein [Pigmentiphaga soli]|uniref:Glycosyltransferase family 2 protein n=1 Tax=Pigmentiphaga soli TaxID=1007095 RepID=A0ABP8GVN6_9BURK
MRRNSIPVSVIVMTKNEARNISKCLAALADFAEVFVVDSRSTDATCTLAAAHGARVVPFDWNGRYPKKKQWCLENLPFSHDAVLYVDADEEMTPALAAEIRACLPRFDAGYAGAFIAFDYVFCGKTLRHGHRVYKLALLDRTRARFLDYDDLAVAHMWEVEGHYQPQVQGRTFALAGRMVHDDHDSLFHYFDKHNRYSDWEASLRLKGLAHDPREANLAGRAALKRAFAALPCKGLAAFLHSYVLRLGMLDGKAGFDYALARAMYYWQIGLKAAELRRDGEVPQRQPGDGRVRP